MYYINKGDAEVEMLNQLQKSFLKNPLQHQKHCPLLAEITAHINSEAD